MKSSQDLPPAALSVVTASEPASLVGSFGLPGGWSHNLHVPSHWSSDRLKVVNINDKGLGYRSDVEVGCRNR